MDVVIVVAAEGMPGYRDMSGSTIVLFAGMRPAAGCCGPMSSMVRQMQEGGPDLTTPVREMEERIYSECEFSLFLTGENFSSLDFGVNKVGCSSRQAALTNLEKNYIRQQLLRRRP
jgi:hypothetical protein